MATNNFKPFATAANANVTSQADWEALPALLSGFTSGKASSAQVNKAIRQATTIAALVGQFIANSGSDALDNADVNGLVTKFTSALNKTSQPLDATLTALAALATGANKLPYFTGTDTAAQTDLTPVGRDIIGKTSISDILSYLGLGGMSTLPLPSYSLIVANGYIAIPLSKTQSFFIQWMSISKTGDGTVSKAFTFPIPFPNACATMVGSDSGGAAVAYGFGSLTQTGGLLYVPSTATGGALTARAIAVGY